MRRSTCPSIAGIIQGHSKALVQIATQKLPEYGMLSDDTKCLNTAVTLMYLLLGVEALRYTRHCDVSNVVSRYKRLGDISARQAREVSAQLVAEAPRRAHELWYVMITDGNLTRQGSDVRLYFPGHVFLIELSPGGGDDAYFNLYQSYVRKYNLDEYLDAANDTTRSKAFLHYIARELLHMFSIRAWDRRCSSFWRTFAMATGSAFEGYDIRGRLFLCYQKIPMETCTGSLRKLLDDTARQLRDVPASEDRQPFGEMETLPGSTPLTNAEMREHVRGMLGKLSGEPNRGNSPR